MRRTCLLFLALAPMLQSLAQNQQLDYQRAVKLNNVTSYEERLTFQTDTSGLLYRYSTMSWQLLHPSVSFQLMDSSKNLHEFELLDLTLNNVRNTGESLVDSTRAVNAVLYDQQASVTNISLRYEYIFNLAKRKNTRLVPSLGFALNPQYRLVKVQPFISNFFPSSEQTIALRTHIIPRLTYYLSKNLLIDLNLPFCLTNTSHNTDIRKDPAIPAHQQKISNFNFEAFPQLYSLRIGIGLKM